MTPFGRQPVTAGLLATHALAEAPAPAQTCNKWSVLRDLTAARRSFGISDRDLVVLSALLSCYPAAQLSDDAALIVFPSNATLSDRAHGMPESTLRRHIAALVNAGLILRRDSPNGKRYARRSASGQITRAFGFDLRPLVLRADEIAQAATVAYDAAHALRCQRETVVIGLRDLSKLIDWAAENQAKDWTAIRLACSELQSALRRKLDIAQLQQMERNLSVLMKTLHAEIGPTAQPETIEMGGNHARNERHNQSSNKESLESEQCDEEKVRPRQTISLALVLNAAPQIRDYSPDAIRTWDDLLRTADIVRPMLGITQEAWQHACRIMGPEAAAITLACILERHETILRPGGYLRSLTVKAEGQEFSPGPMVMALLRCENRRQL